MAAAGHQPAAAGHGLEAGLPSRGTHMLEHHVHAASTSEGADLVGPVRLGMVDHQVGAQSLCLGHFLRAAGGGDNAGAGQLGNLHAQHPNARAGGDHQHILTHAQPGATVQHVPGRRSGHGHGGGLQMREATGQCQQLSGRCHHILCIAAGGLNTENAAVAAHVGVADPAGRALPAKQDGIDHHLVAALPASYIWAHIHDIPCHLGARDVRQRYRRGGLAIAGEQVHLVESAGLDSEQDRAWSGSGHRHIQVQLQPAMALDRMYTHGAHGGGHGAVCRHAHALFPLFRRAR